MTGARVLVRRLDPGLPMPARARGDDAGLDLYAAEAATIEPGARALVPTGLALAIPPGYAGFVLPRSGLALRHGITLLNTPGLVDAGYRGEIKVLLVNHGGEAATVARGDRIAQLVIQRVESAKLVEVDERPRNRRLRQHRPLTWRHGRSLVPQSRGGPGAPHIGQPPRPDSIVLFALFRRSTVDCR
jgi:dUTP pyrophosphatase